MKPKSKGKNELLDFNTPPNPDPTKDVIINKTLPVKAPADAAIVGNSKIFADT